MKTKTTKLANAYISIASFGSGQFTPAQLNGLALSIEKRIAKEIGSGASLEQIMAFAIPNERQLLKSEGLASFSQRGNGANSNYALKFGIKEDQTDEYE